MKNLMWKTLSYGNSSNTRQHIDIETGVLHHSLCAFDERVRVHSHWPSSSLIDNENGGGRGGGSFTTMDVFDLHMTIFLLFCNRSKTLHRTLPQQGGREYPRTLLQDVRLNLPLRLFSGLLPRGGHNRNVQSGFFLSEYRLENWALLLQRYASRRFPFSALPGHSWINQLVLEL